MNDLHGKIMNLNPEKRKQNLAIDEAIKNNKNLKDIMVAVYARAFRDARHAAAELASEEAAEIENPKSIEVI